MNTYILTTNNVSIQDYINVSKHMYTIEVDQQVKDTVQKCRDVLDNLTDVKAYGITTGFGALKDTVIDTKDRNILQHI